ncbi:uncharacterized protein LOC123545166 [Mercenaria mercenaria]|uniref:uncharacterized protein LOC123545166 n=1 Tax=Mercenaria mercenaria TaxID=6596 RepID=UPI00234E65BE|nr:uncharacterized protein LOC123545166 [Mercenaria mercenaria]
MEEMKGPENVNETMDKESKFIEENDIARSSVPNMEMEVVGNEKEILKGIPNAVQTVNEEVEKSQEQELKTPKYSANVSELRPPVISEMEDVNDKPSDSDNLESGGWKRLAKQEKMNGGGQTVSDVNDRNGSKFETSSFPRRKGSLSVPAFSTLLKDERRESTVSKSSKLSLLSPISRRSVQLKTGFTTVQMPVDEKSSVLQQEDSWIRVAIPYLPLWVAVLCLLLNILIPGSGTILSGLCILCCAKSRVPPKYDPDPVLLICVNTWVGIAQLFTVTFLLVGWFWSIAWGIRMVILSLEQRRELREQRAIQLKEQALSAFGKALARKM